MSTQQRTHHAVTRHTLLLLAPGAVVVCEEPAGGNPDLGREPADDLAGGHPQSTLDLREIVRRDSAQAGDHGLGASQPDALLPYAFAERQSGQNLPTLPSLVKKPP